MNLRGVGISPEYSNRGRGLRPHININQSLISRLSGTKNGPSHSKLENLIMFAAKLIDKGAFAAICHKI